MKYQYITIEREFGSGGTRIGELLAKECKMPCYGREILECVARKYDISVEQIEQYEEGVTNSFLYTVFVMSKAQSGDMNMLSDEGMFISPDWDMKARFIWQSRLLFKVWHRMVLQYLWDTVPVKL